MSVYAILFNNDYYILSSFRFIPDSLHKSYTAELAKYKVCFTEPDVMARLADLQEQHRAVVDKCKLQHMEMKGTSQCQIITTLNFKYLIKVWIFAV